MFLVILGYYEVLNTYTSVTNLSRVPKYGIKILYKRA